MPDFTEMKKEAKIEKTINDENKTNKPQKGIGGLIAYYVLLAIVFIFSCPTVIFAAAVGGNYIFSGAIIIFVLLLIAPIVINIIIANRKIVNKIDDAPSSGNALNRFIKTVDLIKPNGNPEEFYKDGVVFVKQGQFDDGIIEFIKVIKTASPEDDVYVSAQKELEDMGFSKLDIENAR